MRTREDKSMAWKVIAGMMMIILGVLIALTKGCGDRPEEVEPRPTVYQEGECEIEHGYRYVKIVCPDYTTSEQLRMEIDALIVMLHDLRRELEENSERDLAVEAKIKEILEDIEVLEKFRTTTTVAIETIRRSGVLIRESLVRLQKELDSILDMIEEEERSGREILVSLQALEDRIVVLELLEQSLDGRIESTVSGMVESIENATVANSVAVDNLRAALEALPSRPVEYIELCGNADRFGEILVRLSDGTLVAIYAEKNKERLAIIKPGRYITTDGYDCRFEVTEDGDVVEL